MPSIEDRFHRAEQRADTEPDTIKKKHRLIAAIVIFAMVFLIVVFTNYSDIIREILISALLADLVYRRLG